MKDLIQRILREEIDCFVKRNKILNPLNECFKQYNKSFDKRLFEGLIKSYPVETVIKHMCEYCNFASSQLEFNNGEYNGVIFSRKEENDLYSLIIIAKNDEKIINIIKQAMNFYGYVISYFGKTDFSDEFIEFICEKRLENKINDLVKENGVLYHVTLKSRLESILKNGFVPKHHDKKSIHDSRIYFILKGGNIFKFQTIAYELYGKCKDDLVVIKINSSNLSSDFYFDPNMDGAVFTTDNISPNNIIDYKVFNLYKKIDEIKVLSLNKNVDNRGLFNTTTKEQRKKIFNEVWNKYYYNLLSEQINHEMINEDIKNNNLYFRKEYKIILNNILENLKET